MFNYNESLDNSENKRVHQLAGYLDSQIRTMYECLSNIINSTESDIWGNATLQAKQGIQSMKHLLDNGYIR